MKEEMKELAWPASDEPRRALIGAKNKARRDLIQERYSQWRGCLNRSRL
jgi:hypothetical protein